ncbi:hypothetical protein RKD32_007392, partial [Streptomyces sp. SAI-195]
MTYQCRPGLPEAVPLDALQEHVSAVAVRADAVRHRPRR